MKNFQPGGLRNRKPDLGGRPQSDVNNYAPKKRFESAPRSSEGRGQREVQLFKTNCTTCGRECEVPFRPDGKKPVLCRDCFAAKNAAPTNATNRTAFTPNERIGRKPERNYAEASTSHPQTLDYSILTKQLNALEVKVNQLLELVKASEVIVKALPSITPMSATDAISAPSEVPTKVRKPKKTTPAIKKAAVKKKAAVAKKVAKKTK